VRVLTLGASAIGLVVLLVVIFRLRVRPIVEARVPGEDWQRTEEVVHDPATGRTLRVWIDPADGTRYTVAELR
jgi:hypothetical protein